MKIRCDGQGILPISASNIQTSWTFLKVAQELSGLLSGLAPDEVSKTTRNRAVILGEGEGPGAVKHRRSCKHSFRASPLHTVRLVTPPPFFCVTVLTSVEFSCTR